jgi:hypothetical protein
MMALVELMVAEYRYTLHAAIFQLSLTSALAMMAARHARLGDGSRPGYGDQAADAARARVNEYFQKHYQIV